MDARSLGVRSVAPTLYALASASAVAAAAAAAIASGTPHSCKDSSFHSGLIYQAVRLNIKWCGWCINWVLTRRLHARWRYVHGKRARVQRRAGHFVQLCCQTETWRRRGLLRQPAVDINGKPSRCDVKLATGLVDPGGDWVKERTSTRPLTRLSAPALSFIDNAILSMPPGGDWVKEPHGKRELRTTNETHQRHRTEIYAGGRGIERAEARTALAALGHRTIVFIGDSNMRYQYLTLLAFNSAAAVGGRHATTARALRFATSGDQAARERRVAAIAQSRWIATIGRRVGVECLLQPKQPIGERRRSPRGVRLPL